MRRLSRSQQRFFARIHFWLLGFSLFGYLALVFMLGPGFLAFDVSQKIHALADELIVVTAVVLGPPATPVVTATPSCVSGVPRITLDWADDAASSSWDIDRDSLPLTTGLTSSAYIDTAVTGTVSYDYIVTAHGPMAPGVATSSTVSATAIDCSTLLPDPTLTLTALGKKDITPPRTTPVKIDGNRPLIVGNTNITSAVVSITVTRPDMYIEVTANSNGYFSWRLPRELREGVHTLTVTATDPNDSSRTISETLEFYVNESDREDEPAKKKTDISLTLAPSQPPFDFEVAILSTGATLRQGDSLAFRVTPRRGLFPTDSVFQLHFFDSNGQDRYTAPSYSVTAGSRPGFDWRVEVPVYLSEGTYTLEITGVFGEVTVSHTATFVLEPLPFLYLGGSGIITYSEAANFLGWILFGLLTLLILFFFVLAREYWLYLHGFRHITERELRRFGLIAWRKGVEK